MRRRKLVLNRETLSTLGERDLRRIAGGNETIQSGETACWCTNCNPCEIEAVREVAR